MAYKITYNPPSPESLSWNDPAVVFVTLAWDVGDIPPTPDDTFIFDLAMPQPIPTGAIDSGNVGGGFPYNARMLGFVNLNSRRAIFQAPFIGHSLGRIGLTGSLASQPTVTKPYEFNVYKCP